MSSRGSANLLHPDRLFPVESKTRDLARELYQSVANLPILSPHGHTDQDWFAFDTPFADPVSLLLTPDHYVLRMLYSQGIPLTEFGVFPAGETPREFDPRRAWRRFAENYHLFRGTPTDIWMKHVFHEVFGIDQSLNGESSDLYFDQMNDRLRSDAYKPRALFDRFKIEVLATTDAATDTLDSHQKIRTGWGRRVIPTYRPDAAVDPEHELFFESVRTLGELTGENTATYTGYLKAHRTRRDFFKKMGATATDHGHPTPMTADLSSADAEKLFAKLLKNDFTAVDAELFRAHMLLKMAEMSIDDGLVMQLHPGSFRNHNPWLMKTFGRDKGADIPIAVEYTRPLKALLDKFGNDTRLGLILYTLDETTYSRELAPLAGHYPALRLGAPWWFHDSPEGMIRFRRGVTETAGFYNTAGFVDDTRAFFSIPARHDVSRRIDARFLSELVNEHRMTEADAFETIKDLSSTLARKAYRL
ncbi:MAG TPA: glucuronate isomerase [Bdellovibrionales bacterium]|nr:glucuronate isomerase [Bdellovibrionales bacterium]